MSEQMHSSSRMLILINSSFNSLLQFCYWTEAEKKYCFLRLNCSKIAYHLWKNCIWWGTKSVKLRWSLVTSACFILLFKLATLLPLFLLLYIPIAVALRILYDNTTLCVPNLLLFGRLWVWSHTSVKFILES